MDLLEESKNELIEYEISMRKSRIKDKLRNIQHFRKDIERLEMDIKKLSDMSVDVHEFID